MMTRFTVLSDPQTTVEPRAFWNEPQLLVDLPGINTSLFPRESFVDMTGLRGYQCAVLVFQGRFRESDAWLASTALELEMELLVARTMLDKDVANYVEDVLGAAPEQLDSTKAREVKEAVVKHVREDMVQQLRGVLGERADSLQTFGVSGKARHREGFDMPLLRSALSDLLP